MTQITKNDCLEIRDAGGDTLHKGVDIFEIDKEKIYSHMGTFIIDGSKNESGEETFIPLVLPEDYNATHAVMCTEKRLKKGKLTYHDVEQMMAEIFEKIHKDYLKFTIHDRKKQLDLLYRHLSEIESTRRSTNSSLIHIFLDQYEKSVKSSIDEIKNS